MEIHGSVLLLYHCGRPLFSVLAVKSSEYLNICETNLGYVKFAHDVMWGKVNVNHNFSYQ